MTDRAIPRVVVHAHQGIQRGVNQLVGAVRPTLGPIARMVMVERMARGSAPELLDSAGLISRRIVQLADREADVGAMFVRHVLWRVQDEIGDGTATAAVLFQAVYDRGVQHIAAGGDPMRLRRALEQALGEVLAELDTQTQPISGQHALSQLAESLCFDPQLAKLLGEIFDIVGEHGQVEVRRGHGRTLDRQYVEGMYWPSGVLSPHFYSDPTKLRADLLEPAIVISDLTFDDPRQLALLIERAKVAGHHSLVIVANKLSDAVIAVLLASSCEEFRVVAVRTPGNGPTEQATTLRDLAVLCGGKVLLAAAGESARTICAEHFGHARRAWANRIHLGIVGGKANPHALREHIACLRNAEKTTRDQHTRAALRERLGKFMGGAATLLIGGATESEMMLREQNANKTAGLIRSALRDGVLPGGGQALLACRKRLRKSLVASTDFDQQIAYRLLIRALEEPLRTIANNAGYSGASVISQVDAAPGHYFDARSGKLIEQEQAGIFDVAAAQKAAVHYAIAGAATALTVETVIHKRHPMITADHP